MFVTLKINTENFQLLFLKNWCCSNGIYEKRQHSINQIFKVKQIEKNQNAFSACNNVFGCVCLVVCFFLSFKIQVNQFFQPSKWIICHFGCSFYFDYISLRVSHTLFLFIWYICNTFSWNKMPTSIHNWLLFTETREEKTWFIQLPICMNLNIVEITMLLSNVVVHNSLFQMAWWNWCGEFNFILMV